MEIHSSVDREEYEEAVDHYNRPGLGKSNQSYGNFQPACGGLRFKDGNSLPQYDLVSWGGTDQGGAKMDQMDLEGRGEADASF